MKRVTGVISVWELFLYWIYSIHTKSAAVASLVYGQFQSATENGAISNITGWNPQSNNIKQGRTNFWSYESVNVKRLSSRCLLSQKVWEFRS